MGPALLLALLAVAALVSPAAALDVPPLTGRVVDNAHLLSADRANLISNELAAHEARTGNQVAVLTLPSLEGEPLEEFSHRVATTWKLGQKGTDNGVLILVVPGERKIRIEVGYGLEGTLTDVKSSRIIREEMAPRFRVGDFDGGITAGVRAVLGTIEGTYQPPNRPRARSNQLSDSPWSVVLLAVLAGMVTAAFIGHRWRGSAIGGMMALFLALSSGLLLAIIAAVVVFLFSRLMNAAGGGGRMVHGGFGGWGGGFGDFGGSGGGFSGGGGDFGGGGASGGWD